MRVAILTTPNQWFIQYAKQLNQTIVNSKLFFQHKDIDESYDIVFILSYHSIIETKYLKKNRHNIVIHASDLPRGKGWSPMFWQILEDKKDIIFSMFEASDGVDSGSIYMKKTLFLNGYELNNELREKQALFTMQMCLEFLKNYSKYKKPSEQLGRESFYKKRTSADSLLDINKSINEQFNLLRIVDNDEYPAFFYKNGKKYLLKIEEALNENS